MVTAEFAASKLLEKMKKVTVLKKRRRKNEKINKMVEASNFENYLVTAHATIRNFKMLLENYT